MATINLRVLYILAVFSLMACSSGSKISWDRIKEGETRHVGTNSLEQKIEKGTYWFTLTVFVKNETKDYCLLISSLSKLENNAIVLLKLGNQETIKLVADNTNVGKVDWPNLIPVISGRTRATVITTKEVDYYTAIFDLTDEDMKKFEKYGITKIRVQYFDSYREKTWDANRLGEFIKRAHSTIEAQLQTPNYGTKAIEKDF